MLMSWIVVVVGGDSVDVGGLGLLLLDVAVDFVVVVGDVIVAVVATFHGAGTPLSPHQEPSIRACRVACACFLSCPALPSNINPFAPHQQTKCTLIFSTNRAPSPLPHIRAFLDTRDRKPSEKAVANAELEEAERRDAEEERAEKARAKRKRERRKRRK